MKLKIGQSCQVGDLIVLSKAGNIRKALGGMDRPIGVAATRLVQGRIAFESVPGHWAMEGTVDPELSRISMSYLIGHEGTPITCEKRGGTK